MSLARQTRDHVLSIIAASAPVSGGGLSSHPGGGLSPADLLPEVAPYTPAAEVAARQIAMRLTHDLRRLKDIKSIDRKIAAKREMLPAYHPWVDGLVAAGRDVPAGIGPAALVPPALAAPGAEEVLPVVMVWSIDVADWPRALAYAEHVLRFDVKMPARYERDAATLILEEIAETALKAQARGDSFPLDVLEQVELLTAGIDMHDEPRAKLHKAIGTELGRAAGDAEGSTARTMILGAIAQLGQAQALHDRVGVKTQLKGLERALAALPPVDPADGTSSTQADPVSDTTTPPIAAEPIDTDAMAARIADQVAGPALALHDTLTALASANRTPATSD